MKKAKDFPQAQITAMARAAHSVTIIYQIAIGEVPSPMWDDEVMRTVRPGVEEGVRLAVDGATAEALHESWMKTKLREGWVYGSEKDFIRRTHPCLRPYRELAGAQQRKDDLFRSVVIAMAQAID